MVADQYFTAEPAGPSREREVSFEVAGRAYTMVASGGVFSAGRLDPGTSVLLHKASLPGPRGGVYLDLGCGYGPIATVLAGTSGNARVYALDVNRRALDLVARNAAAAGVRERVIPVTAAEVADAIAFDEIWSNPPIRIGKAALHDLLGAWLPRLRRGGVAWLVVAKHLGGDSLAAWLSEGGWAVTRHASQQGYRVLRVEHEALQPAG